MRGRRDDGVQPSRPWPHELRVGCAVQAVEFRHKQPRGARERSSSLPSYSRRQFVLLVVSSFVFPFCRGSPDLAMGSQGKAS